MKFPTATPDSLACAGITTQLVTFFAATFLIAWAAWIPLIRKPFLPGQIAFLGLFAPALAALLTAAISRGTRGVRDIVRRLSIVAFPPGWALFSALIMPAIFVTTVLAPRAVGLSQTVPLLAGNSPHFILAAFLWLLFVNSGEELGWRGYALPRLLEHSDRPILVSLGLGVIWGIWHLPLYLLPGQSAFPLPLFLIFTSLQSVLYTVVFIRTKGSLLPALLLHAGTDIAPRVFQLTRLPTSFWLIVDLTLGLAVTALLLGLRRQISSVQQGTWADATNREGPF